MITATGNNFGASEISLRDYQTENMAVLNGRFSIDPTNETFSSGETLEIYVPDLTLTRSAVSSCIIRGTTTGYKGTSYERTMHHGTVLHIWIKDKNTICIENLGIYTDYESVEIVINAIFCKLGLQEPAEALTKTTLTFTYDSTSCRISEQACVITDNWVFLNIVFNTFPSPYSSASPVVVTLNNFPTDVTVDTLLVGGSDQVGEMGYQAFNATIENGVLSIELPSIFGASSVDDRFVYFFAVRDTE